MSKFVKSIRGRMSPMLQKTLNAFRTAAQQIQEDQRGGDAGTNFIIGVLIAVVVVGLLIGLLNVAMPQWWAQLSTRVMDVLNL